MLPIISSNTYRQTLPNDPKLVAWYDATRVLGVNTSNPVDSTALSMVADLSGNSNHVFQNTGANQPLFKTGIQNSLPAIHFVDSNDVLSTLILNNIDTATMYIACVSKPPSTNATKVNYAIESNSTLQNYYTSSGSVSSQAPLDITNASTVTVPGYTAVTNLLEHYYQSSVGHFLQLNGGTASSIAHASAYTMINPILRMGNNGSFTFGGQHIMELILYGRMLSASERTIVRNYLNAKWSVY